MATDFSPRAGRAVKRAAELARQHGCGLGLLHVMGRLSPEVFTHVLRDHPLVTEKRLHDAAARRLNDLADVLHSHYGVFVAHHVAIGTPYTEINRYADSQGADLVVLGAHGENFVRDLLLGSTTSKVLRTAQLPVLIVRSGDADPYRRVLLALDFSECCLRAVRLAQQMVPRAEFHALHILESSYEEVLRSAGTADEVVIEFRQAASDAAGRRMAEVFSAVPDRNRVTFSIESGYPPTAILEYAGKWHADLIALGRRGLSEQAEGLLGSAAKHVIYEADCDLLVAQR
ncbi:MAG: universal stress protein [Desulfobacterales bacterium]|nr:universal stress protein [Desulfobacterales bacterium]